MLFEEEDMVARRQSAAGWMRATRSKTMDLMAAEATTAPAGAVVAPGALVQRTIWLSSPAL